MRVIVDTDTGQLTVEGPPPATLPLYSDAAFEILSELWTKVGWNQKHSYGFSWLGRPIIQLPSDIVRIQEVIHRVQPDVIVETGIAHGGSLILYASLCKVLGRGRVVGVDVVIRPANRAAIERHPLASLVTLVEGDSTSAEVVRRVQGLVRSGERVLVLLDSDHRRAHVLRELEAYHGLVTPGSYIVATDGIMRDLHDTPRGAAGWRVDNPATAAEEFASRHPEFVLEPPAPPFDERTAPVEVTHWRGGWLRRREAGPPA
jgi:cephalosporin hydroxylase